MRRRDYLFNVAGQLAPFLYWFHPLLWYAVDWETRSRASHEFGSFARDAFNERFIHLGLYLADRAFEANPLSDQTYAVMWLMLLPRYAVGERLKAAAVEGIIRRDLAALGRIPAARGLRSSDDAHGEIATADAERLARLEDGIRAVAYRSLYRWTEKQAYFDSIVAIGARLDAGGHDPGQLFSLAQLTKDPVASVEYLRRFLAATPSEGHDPIVVARAYQQALTLAAEHPGLLEDVDADRFFVAWRAILDRAPLVNMPTDQAEYDLVRADYALACRRGADELKSVRRRLQARLDDPALEDHFFRL